MQKPTRQAFTLVELLISTVLLVTLLLILVSMINQTSGVWRFTTNKVEQFSRAQNAFDAITRRLSQATLNTYWDYDSPNAPTKYIRQSDLRFISGSAQALTGGTASSPNTPTTRPGHGIFFQAPLGYSDAADFRGLENLLNSWGYYIDFSSDSQTRPAFLDSLNPKLPLRYRYRLMELMQPSNKLAIYSAPTSNGWTGTGWFTGALSATPSQVHVLAENVVALVLLPKLSPKEDSTGTALAPEYSYDSTVTNGNAALNPFNQLPPLVQVTLVALDDLSAGRVANGEQAPDLGISGLFDPNSPNSASNYQADLAKLQGTLAAKKLNYRIFSTQVVLRAAKWSRN